MTMMIERELDLDEEMEWQDEYAGNHPIYENGKIVGYTYPNGSVRLITDEELLQNYKY